jgi:hypothetical protein
MSRSPRTAWIYRTVFGAILYGLIVACLSSCALSLAGRIIAPEVLDNYPPPPPELRRSQDLLGIVLIGGGVAMGILAALRKLRSNQPTESSLCQKCGYNLTGSVSGVCPECGQKLNGTTTA